MTVYIQAKEAIATNALLIKRQTPGEEIRVKDPSMLESALARPQQTVFGKDAYEDIFYKAAALLESLVKNHAFANANKRTAIVLCRVFLKKNRMNFQPSQYEFEEMPVAIATNKVDLMAVAYWLKENSKPL